MKRLLKAVIFPAIAAVAASSAPVRFDPQEGLRQAGACGQIDQPPATGTCCRQISALCIIGMYREEGRFYKSEGACP